MQEKLANVSGHPDSEIEERRVMALGSQRTTGSREWSVFWAVSRPTGISELCPVGGVKSRTTKLN